MASSPEYYALHQSNNTQFIRGLYLDLVARGSSSTEVEVWLNKLNTGETRAQVVTEFLKSPEYRSSTSTGCIRFICTGRRASWK